MATKHGEFEFVGKHPSLDFINTASDRDRAEPTERLGSYNDLISWSLQAGLLSEGRARHLETIAAAKPQAAAEVLADARDMREAGFRLFDALITSLAPVDADVEMLNRMALRTVSSGSVEWDGDAFVLHRPPPAAEFDEPLCCVAQGVVELLAGEQSKYISRCDNQECGWLFLDRSPGRRRKWCSMADCGNRAKVRRHYAKTRAARQDKR